MFYAVSRLETFKRKFKKNSLDPKKYVSFAIEKLLLICIEILVKWSNVLVYLQVTIVISLSILILTSTPGYPHIMWSDKLLMSLPNFIIFNIVKLSMAGY